MKNNTLEYQLEAWLDDQLPDEAAAEIQYLVETDPEVLELLAIIKTRRLVVKETQANYYKEKLDSWEKEKPIKNRLGWTFIEIILFFVSITCFIIGIINLPGPINTIPNQSTEMAANIYENQPTIPDQKGENNGMQPVDLSNIKKPQNSNAKKTIKKVQKPSPVIVLRFLSSTAEDLEKNFVIDTLTRARSRLSQWEKVTDKVFVSNDVSETEAYPGIGKTIRRGNHKIGSVYDKGIDTLKNNPNEGVRLLLSVDPENGEYDMAQQALAYYYLSKKDYPKAIMHYENFYQKNDRYDVQWMMLGFYLHNYEHHKQEVKNLIDLFSSDQDSKYGPPASLLKKQLKL